jgi:tRNA(Ile)-lysidine synthase TilS/MesJ
MTNPGMKCSRCRRPASHRFPQHNLRLCDPCLEVFVERQVERAIKKWRMLAPGQEVAAAISGGKDSLALWQILTRLGYRVKAVHISLGFPEFSQDSLAACRAMARLLDAPLEVRGLEDWAGLGVEQVARANRREHCAVCGGLKRHLLNRLCWELGADTLATGHHLDDEAGRLLGNLMRRHSAYLERQWPVLEGMAPPPGGRVGLARKVKPLVRLAGDEIRAYARSQGLPAHLAVCPKSKGATLTNYQDALELMEERMPGTKRDLYFGFLRQKAGPPPPPEPGSICPGCGGPTQQETCSACLLLRRARESLAARQRREGGAA